jgi:hypothetical protein
MVTTVKMVRIVLTGSHRTPNFTHFGAMGRPSQQQLGFLLHTCTKYCNDMSMYAVATRVRAHLIILLWETLGCFPPIAIVAVRPSGRPSVRPAVAVMD